MRAPLAAGQTASDFGRLHRSRIQRAECISAAAENYTSHHKYVVKDVGHGLAHLATQAVFEKSRSSPGLLSHKAAHDSAQ
jgi:hypothetical protein